MVLSVEDPDPDALRIDHSADTMADVEERFYAMQMQKQCKRLDIWGSSIISLSDLASK